PAQRGLYSGAHRVHRRPDERRASDDVEKIRHQGVARRLSGPDAAPSGERCRWSATPCDIFRTNSSWAANHLSRPPKDLAKHEGFRSAGDASRLANRTLQTDGVRGFSPIDCGGRQDSHGFRGSPPEGVPSEETLCRTDRTLVVSGDFASWMEGLDRT